MQREDEIRIVCMNDLIIDSGINQVLKDIAQKVFDWQRITSEEGIILFEQGELGYLGMLANYVKEKKSGRNIFFNNNYHIEPTNVCVMHCTFCSYRKDKGEDQSWSLNINDIIDEVEKRKGKGFTEVHIVGAVHPDYDLEFYKEIFSRIKQADDKLHIKALTAVEIEYLSRIEKTTFSKVLEELKSSGLDSMPGGGAEIFDEEIRKDLCPDKVNSEDWLRIHQEAHLLGIPTNATMLYGHKEDYENRIDHLNRIRALQDISNGFNAFIPLKYKTKYNKLNFGEVNLIEDLKNYAITRIFLDNVPHIKAYWPMIGKQASQLSLSYGVDDLDGTIDDSTKIYSMAGADEKSPDMSVTEIVNLIKAMHLKPVERDSVYNTIKEF